MKTFLLAIFGILLAATICHGALAQGSRSLQYSQAIEHIKTLPKPPAGFKWAVNPDFTDEFEGGKLDSEKWYDKSPYRKNGRPPATFKAYNVSVQNGCLRIKNSRLKSTGHILLLTILNGRVCNYPIFASLARCPLRGGQALRPQTVQPFWERN